MRATVVVPAYNREDTIDRCIRSIAQQGLSGWEIMLVDDASTDDTKKRIIEWEKKHPKNIVGLKFKEHMERVIAFNSGISYARGDWVIMLDSDDELASHFIKAFEDARRMHPLARIFSWGSLVHWRDQDGRYTRTDVRQTFKPEALEDGTVGVFRSGEICSGGFAFDRKMVFERGYLPAASNPYTLGERFLKWYPELKPLYNEGQTDLGNPWGQDFAWFYHLTRGLDMQKLQPLEQILHIQHVRQ